MTPKLLPPPLALARDAIVSDEGTSMFFCVDVVVAFSLSSKRFISSTRARGAREGGHLAWKAIGVPLTALYGGFKGGTSR